MELSEIKQNLSIQKVLLNYGLQPDQNQMLRCPFHNDGTASMKVYLNTNTFNCFGCGKNGDVIEFIQQKEGCTKHKAILKAKSLVNGQAIEEPVVSEAELPTSKTNYGELFKTFTESLKRSSKAKEYLQSRNLVQENVGYNPARGGTSSGKSYNKLKNCIVFPLRDKDNNIVSLYGRSILNNNDAKHFYTSNRKGLYPNYPKPETKKLILTEAIIDAATLQLIISNEQLVIENESPTVLACYGTNGLTKEHKEAIANLKELQEVILFFDGDEAGCNAVKEVGKTLSIIHSTLSISYIQTPDNEDVNSLSIAYDSEYFQHLLDNRKVLFSSTSEASLTAEAVCEGLLAKDDLVEPIKKEEPPKVTATLNVQNPDYITYQTSELLITILGGINLQQLDRLRLTLKINRTNSNDPLHSIRHTIDLYHTDYVEKFINKASEQLELGTNLIRRAIAGLTEQVEQYRLQKLESQKEQKPQERKLTEQRQKKAIHYLKSKNLMQRTNQDIGKTGVIGEETNRLLMYLVFTSRKREHPLHIISLGASGTGKTYLQEKIADLIPENDKIEITVMSENAFYYFGQKELKNKLILIEDMDGIMEVLLPLRELQSKKWLVKTLPIKDSKGNWRTIRVKVEGPICLAGTTTKEKLYEDNANRSLLIYLDGSGEQKEKIMDYQRKLSAGKVNAKQENQLKAFFKDMQTVLKPIKVRNPYAEFLKLPEYVFKPLRTNAHYLAVIETITFYHQYQREIKTDPETNEKYIETTLEDIEWANKLLKDVLLTKADELNQAERSFFESLKTWLKTNNTNSFFSKQVRDYFRMHPSKVKRYLHTLSMYNLIRVIGGNRYKSGFEYEIVSNEEYKHLQSTVNTVLDDTLNKLKQKFSGSRGLQVAHKQNNPLNNHETKKLGAVV